MSANVLEFLASDDFVLSLGTYSTAESLRRGLLRSRHVRGLREGLARGRITEDSIRRLTGRLLLDFRRGESFRHETALAAIAVALETWNSDFACDFLIDLARTKITEFALCRRVAGLSARAWARLPKVTKIQAWPQVSIQNPPPSIVRMLPARSPAVARREKNKFAAI